MCDHQDKTVCTYQALPRNSVLPHLISHAFFNWCGMQYLYKILVSISQMFPRNVSLCSRNTCLTKTLPIIVVAETKIICDSINAVSTAVPHETISTGTLARLYTVSTILTGRITDHWGSNQSGIRYQVDILYL